MKKSGASALFKSQMNISIIGYLTELRLYRAQSALANSDEKIVNIALDAGFGSMSQFYEIPPRHRPNPAKMARRPIGRLLGVV